MYGYIYKTTNIVNGKIYIGQHLHDCWDFNYKGSGKMLQKAFKKYGEDNFNCELIESADSQLELDNLEKYYIDKYDARNPQVGYNIAEGGRGGSHPAWNKGLNKNTDSRLLEASNNAKKRVINIGHSGACGLRGAYNTRHKASIEKMLEILPEFEQYWKTHFDTEVYKHFHIQKNVYNACIEKLNLDINDVDRILFLKEKKKLSQRLTRQNNNTNHGCLIQCVETGTIFNSIADVKQFLGLKGNGSIYAALDYGKKCRGYHFKRL